MLVEQLWSNEAKWQTESKLLKQKMLEFLGKAVQPIENTIEIILGQRI